MAKKQQDTNNNDQRSGPRGGKNNNTGPTAVNDSQSNRSGPKGRLRTEDRDQREQERVGELAN